MSAAAQGVDMGSGASETGIVGPLGTNPTYARWIAEPPLPQCLLRYDPRSADHWEHMADFRQTYVKPGADPRAKWSGSLTKTDPTIYRDEPHTPKWCEVGPSDRPDLAWINGPWNALGWRLSSRARYVPLDVCRWRDPDHRAALTARARAHAALVPGNRSTMEVER